jgi:hypothetical protein
MSDEDGCDIRDMPPRLEAIADRKEGDCAGDFIRELWEVCEIMRTLDR